METRADNFLKTLGRGQYYIQPHVSYTDCTEYNIFDHATPGENPQEGCPLWQGSLGLCTMSASTEERNRLDRLNSLEHHFSLSVCWTPILHHWIPRTSFGMTGVCPYMSDMLLLSDDGLLSQHSAGHCMGQLGWWVRRVRADFWTHNCYT